MVIRTLAIAGAMAAALGAAAYIVLLRQQPAPVPPAPAVSRERPDKVVKTDAEWRAILTEEQYRVTRDRGTERACSGAYWNTKDDGVYACVCCNLELFDSRTKFDSGTGWPSFFAPIDEAGIALIDENDFMQRTEVRCNRCDAHLGHVFADGPPPTGRRFCMNSIALKHRPRN